MADELATTEQVEERVAEAQSDSAEKARQEVDPTVIAKAQEYDRWYQAITTNPLGVIESWAEQAGYVVVPKHQFQARNGYESEQIDVADEDDEQEIPLKPEAIKNVAKQAFVEVERERMELLAKAKRLAQDAKPLIKTQNPAFQAFEQVYDKLVENIDLDTAHQITQPGGLQTLLKDAELTAYRQGVLGRRAGNLSPLGGYSTHEDDELSEEEQVRRALGWDREKFKKIRARAKELFD